MAIEIGSEPFKVVIPSQFDEASITEAFKYYHQGSLTDSAAPQSMASYLQTIKDRLDGHDNGINDAIAVSTAAQNEVIDIRHNFITENPITDASQPGVEGANYIKVGSANKTIVPFSIEIPQDGRAFFSAYKRAGLGNVLTLNYDGSIKSNRITQIGMDQTATPPSLSRVLTEDGKQLVYNKYLIGPVINMGGYTEQNATFALNKEMLGKVIEVNSSSDVQVIVPEQASPILMDKDFFTNAGYPEGATFTIIRTGTGNVTITGAPGVVPNGTPGLKLRAQYSMATILKRRTGAWIVTGDTIP